MKTYMTRKLLKSTQRSSRVNESNQSINHDSKRRDLITSSKDVSLRRDVYVELNDSMPSNEATRDSFEYDERMYSHETREITTMI